MKIEISTPLIQTICNKLVKAVSTKDIIPSLKNFLIDVTEKNIHITAGDSATYLEKWVGINSVKETGKVSVDGKEFTKLLGKINSDTIVLETTTDNRLRVSAGKSKFHLKTIDVEEYVYPYNLTPDIDGIKINLPEIKKAFKLGSITVSKNATEAYFTGYKIDSKIMTTNRNNLTLYDTNICSDSLLLTPDIVNLLNDMDGESAEISYTSDFIEIKTEGTRILGNLLCGTENFPPNDILDNFNYDKIAVVTKKQLLPILDRAMIFVDSLGAVELCFKKNLVECRLVGNSDVDTYEELSYEGDLDISIKVNVGMLYQIASSIEGDILELHVDDSNSPLLIKSGAYTVLMAAMCVE